jgi:hypothetical protein
LAAVVPRHLNRAIACAKCWFSRIDRLQRRLDQRRS